jgi:hypothetical protein
MPFIRPPWARKVSKRSEWVMPRPAVIQLTSPGRISWVTPVESRWVMPPSNR